MQDIADPNKKEGVFSDAKKRSAALDQELATMHGAKEFIKFMRNKGNSVPDVSLVLFPLFSYFAASKKEPTRLFFSVPVESGFIATNRIG